MPTLYLSERGTYVSLDGESLRLDVPEDKKTGRTKHVRRIPLNHVEQIVVIGDVTLSSGVIENVLQRRICIHYLDGIGRSLGSIVPDSTRNATLRLAQYRAFMSLPHRFQLARSCIDGKLRNLRTQLQRANRKRDEQPVDAAISDIHVARQQLSRLQPPATDDPSDRMHGVGAVFGVEGQGTAAYWRAFGALLNPPWQWNGRVRRPPTDPINAMLSYGYTILIHQALSQIAIVGLDPYIGFLHRPGLGKPALALDLVEEFRPLVVDSTVITVINNGMVTERDFVDEGGSIRLTPDARRTFLQKLEERLNTDIEHPIFNYKASYRRCIELQARLLGKAVMGEIPHYPPFVTR